MSQSNGTSASGSSARLPVAIAVALGRVRLVLDRARSTLEMTRAPGEMVARLAARRVILDACAIADRELGWLVDELGVDDDGITALAQVLAGVESRAVSIPRLGVIALCP